MVPLQVILPLFSIPPEFVISRVIPAGMVKSSLISKPETTQMLLPTQFPPISLHVLTSKFAALALFPRNNTIKVIPTAIRKAYLKPFLLSIFPQPLGMTTPESF